MMVADRLSDVEMAAMETGAAFATTLKKWTAKRKEAVLDVLFTILVEAKRARAAEVRWKESFVVADKADAKARNRIARIAFRLLEDFENGRD